MPEIADQQQMIALIGKFGELAVQYGLDLFGAVVILIVGWIVAGWAHKSVGRALDRASRVDNTLKPFFASTVRYLIMLLVLVAVLAQFGIQTASIIAMLGAAGLAVGLALQGTLQNIAAGIMLLFLRPFRAGDYIDAEGLGGTIDEIALFTTKMRTADGIYVEVPNSKLWNRAITNYTRLPTRRLDIPVGISYADDIEAAQAALMDLVKGDSRVQVDPAPQAMVMALADSSVNLNLRVWTATGDYWALRFDLTKAVKERMDAEGISIPFPQRVMHVHQHTAPAAKPVPRKKAATAKS